MAPTRHIDAHQHFWQIARGDYDWMTEDVAAIQHDSLPGDLAPHLQRHGITGTVVVQAAATVAETEFLLSLAEETDFIKGVVGWVNLTDASAPGTLDRLAKFPKFKGVRPMLQDIEDTRWIAQPKVIAGLKALADRELRLDALITPRHLDVLREVAASLPDLPIVIDHCAKPVIAAGADPGDEWRQGLSRLAELPNVFCKLSGLANEAGPGWNAERLRAVAEHVLDSFGPTRVMWGSDWPVLNLAGDYAAWREVSETLLGGLSAADRAAVFGETASRFYGLDAGESDHTAHGQSAVSG
ncbi:amidohydrolase family protein [Pacificoceanicola onchidii]|uniref:amidohydrolase family protein n=1 Tax=Pacificoceanicola onchidii TaxID=2562685 RepID=UPI0010A63A10|nr:amidohydrolase family protein [Pacificoceanicola onchidii]